MRIARILLLAVVLILVSGVSLTVRETPAQGIVLDRAEHGDLAYELVRRNQMGESRDYLTVSRLRDHLPQELLYENDFTVIKPWKLELADVDGDGEFELLMAVVKTTHFDAVERNRLFVFHYAGETLAKKWTGSQIGGNWRDFRALDLVPAIAGDELVFIEQVEGKGERLGIYYWLDFGFALLAESEFYPQINRLELKADHLLAVQVTDGTVERTVDLQLKQGRLVEMPSKSKETAGD